MGACPSKNRPVKSKLGLGRQSDRPPTHASSRFSPELLESTEAPTSCWGADQPRLHLANQSSYRVSYWVVQEDKNITKVLNTRLASSMGLHLNLGSITGGGVEGSVKKEKEEIIETGQGERVYFLLRDFRMEPRGSTQPTEVPFPADCQAVRVYGFFEEEDEEDQEEDGKWKLYRDKVYSIGRGHKSFALNALDSNITPYARAKAEKQCSR